MDMVHEVGDAVNDEILSHADEWYAAALADYLPALDAGELRTLGALWLGFRAGATYIPNESLCEMMGLSEPTLVRARLSLVKRGLIAPRQAWRFTGRSRRRVTEYTPRLREEAR